VETFELTVVAYGPSGDLLLGVPEERRVFGGPTFEDQTADLSLDKHLKVQINAQGDQTLGSVIDLAAQEFGLFVRTLGDADPPDCPTTCR
jgi:hypothetical protein